MPVYKINDKLKLFASVPMKDKTKEEIFQSFEDCKKNTELALGQEVELLDTWINEEPPEGLKNEEVWLLAKSLEILAQANVACFAKDWDKYRGCIIEHETAKRYDIKILESL